MDGMAEVRRYIERHGEQVTLGQIAAATGLTVEQVARALDELQRSIPSAKGTYRT